MDQTKAISGAFLARDASPEEVFIPEEFSREHKDIARAVDDFIKGEITNLGQDIEVLNYDLSRKLMRKCGELGFLGVDIPEKYGGMELDKISSAVVSEKFGYGAGSFTITELNHTGIGTLPVALFGTEQQRKKYLPGLSSGELIGAFALTEPEAGSDALNALTTATLSDDGRHYILNGAKQFITNAGFADVVFTYGKVDGKQFTAFIVEQTWQGVSVDEEEDKMGWHGTSTRAYHFDNVKVPIENVLGKVGKGHVVALNALNMGRFKVGAICIGSAKRAFSEAVRYAKKRVQFGKAICNFGMIKDKIAGMAIRIYAAESMMYRTAGLIQAMSDGLSGKVQDAGLRAAEALREYLVECSINKVFGSETEGSVVDEEIQIFGGYGYIKGYHPEMAYRHARPNRIWEGTNEINRLVMVTNFIRREEGELKILDDVNVIVERIKKMSAVESESPNGFEAQQSLLKAAKAIFALVFGLAHKRYPKDLRDEQEFVSILGNLMIEIYALETALLRSRKLQGSPTAERAILSMKMTKALFHDSIPRICFLARQALESLGEDEGIRNHLKEVQRLMTCPPINVIGMRRDIADAMIRFGGYGF